MLFWLKFGCRWAAGYVVQGLFCLYFSDQVALENKPRYLDNTESTPAGVQQYLHLKCTLFDDGMAVWELRRICDAL